MTAYYNEFDPKAAAWLRELVAGGRIAPGDVDERDIRDIRPDELRTYRQCHFFAGIGGWSLALRRAGWADDRPVWTGSCPCQPFSAAGKRGGTADERHLWPAFFHLIDQCRPPVVFGEQVASKDGLGWFDLVSADLEGSGYAVGASDLCAAGLGAPHIRQRLWFVGVADASSEGSLPGPHGSLHRGQEGTGPRDAEPERSRPVGPLEHATGDGRLEWRAGADGRGAASGRGLGGPADRDDAGLEGRGQPGRERATERLAGPDGVAGRLADTQHPLGREVSEHRQDGHHGQDAGRAEAHGVAGTCSEVCWPGPANGFWRDADWLYCRDGKWRSVEPGTFPLAHGVSGRVGLLRGYGNAIVPEAAQAFIEAYLDTETLDYRTETA